MPPLLAALVLFAAPGDVSAPQVDNWLRYWMAKPRPLGTAMVPQKMAVTRKPERAGPSLPGAA